MRRRVNWTIALTLIADAVALAAVILVFLILPLLAGAALTP